MGPGVSAQSVDRGRWRRDECHRRHVRTVRDHRSARCWSHVQLRRNIRANGRVMVREGVPDEYPMVANSPSGSIGCSVSACGIAPLDMPTLASVSVTCVFQGRVGMAPGASGVANVLASITGRSAGGGQVPPAARVGCRIAHGGLDRTQSKHSVSPCGRRTDAQGIRRRGQAPTPHLTVKRHSVSLQFDCCLYDKWHPYGCRISHGQIRLRRTHATR